jgi:hypothetical protein
MEKLREFRGIHKTGGRSIRRLALATRRTQQALMNISRDIDIASASNPGAIARAGYTAIDQVTGVISQNRKMLIGIGESIANKLGRDPALAARFVHGIVGIGRAAGIAGAAVTGAAYIMNAWIEKTAKTSAYEEKIQKTWWAVGARKTATRFEEQARREAEQENWFHGATGFTSMFGSGESLSDWWSAGSAKAGRVANKMERFAAMQDIRRALVMQPGSNMMARVATSLGVPIEGLNPEQIQQAVDDQMTDPEATPDQLKHYIDTQKSELLRFSNESAGYGNVLGYGTYLWHLFNEKEDINNWTLQAKEYYVDLAKKRLVALAEGEKGAWRLMSNKQKHDFLVSRDENIQKNDQYRTRHAAVILD